MASTTKRQRGGSRYAKVMKALIVVCWGLMLAALITVIAAGHTGLAALIALAGGLACLAGIFFILYQAQHRLDLGKPYRLKGKRLVLLFVLIGAGILLTLLSSGLN